MCVAIKVENVYKSFGKTVVLQNINVLFEKGKIHGLIGRNGSGKTMLMKCICGFVPVSSGEIIINGKILKNGKEIPDNIGVIIETPGFLPAYSAYRNLKFLADIKGKISKQQIYEAISKVGLDPKSKKHVGKYSLGLKAKGKTIIIASHSSEDISILCDEVYEMDKGMLTAIRSI